MILKQQVLSILTMIAGKLTSQNFDEMISRLLGSDAGDGRNRCTTKSGKCIKVVMEKLC